MFEHLSEQITAGNIKSLARAISLIENEQPGYEKLLLANQNNSSSSIIGITGPPGAGKSTLVDALTGELVKQNKKVAILCIDPSSPFNLGAILGDRIRMNEWYTHPNVFIRSLATRGSLGGLAPRIIEITDIVKMARFDYIIVETVGVGQSEIEIAGLSNVTVVVIVPESGDEVQTMKAGLMEIADVFVINKSDRPGADLYERNLRMMLAPAFSRQQNEVPVVKTVATEKKGISELMDAINLTIANSKNEEMQLALLTEHAWQLLVQKRMNGIDKTELKQRIKAHLAGNHFNLYAFIADFH